MKHYLFSDIVLNIGYIVKFMYRLILYRFHVCNIQQQQKTHKTASSAKLTTVQMLLNLHGKTWELLLLVHFILQSCAFPRQ